MGQLDDLPLSFGLLNSPNLVRVNTSLALWLGLLRITL
jgi:hypothetical protein